MSKQKSAAYFNKNILKYSKLRIYQNRSDRMVMYLCPVRREKVLNFLIKKLKVKKDNEKTSCFSSNI